MMKMFRFQLKSLIFKWRYHEYRIKISPGYLQYPPLWPSCRDYGTSALSSKKWRQNIGLKMKKVDKTRPLSEKWLNREKSMKMDPRFHINHVVRRAFPLLKLINSERFYGFWRKFRYSGSLSGTKKKPLMQKKHTHDKQWDEKRFFHVRER